MVIDWPRLIFALVLLLVPIGLFHGKRVHYRALMRDWDEYWVRTFTLELHLIDLVRGALGAWLLFTALTGAPELKGSMRYVPLVARGVILALATVLQALVCKEREAAHAPFAFMSGLVVGFMPPLVSAFALVTAIAVARGANSPAAFFPVLAVAVGAAGTLFTGKTRIFEMVSLAVAAVLPWLVTLLFPRHFVSSYRARPKGVELPPPR